MTRTEAFDKAWRIAFKEKDFSLVDEIYHPEYGLTMTEQVLM